MKKIGVIILLYSFISQLLAQNCGCQDPLALNYDSTISCNNGTCEYATTTLSPTCIGNLSRQLDGTSTLLYWQNNYWTFIDHYNPFLYQLDSLTGDILDSIQILPNYGKDIEAITQDSTYLYCGDFGNDGSRQDLHILRIHKEQLLAGIWQIDTIFFSYPDQTSFEAHSMQTEFDCEAFIADRDSLFLFTKKWTSHSTTYYALPKTPGRYVAIKVDTLFTDGMITGATYFADKHLLVFCGYTDILAPFLYLLYDYPEHRFFDGNKRKLLLNQYGKQIEAIASSNMQDYYLTNEYFSIGNFTFIPQLQKINLSPYLSYYIGDSIINDSISNNNITEINLSTIHIFPNPVNKMLYIDGLSAGSYYYYIYDSTGRCVETASLHEDHSIILQEHIPSGSYHLLITNGLHHFHARFIKY